jgi:transcriptional regulator with XRE-family HTH domain
MGGVLLTIAGEKVPVKHQTVGVETVRLNANNPRIRFQLKHRGGSKDQASLLAIVKSQPGYDGLQKAIRKAGGLHDPIIVSHDGVVIEGNSRTAAVLTLHHGAKKKDPRWKKLPIVRLPKTVPERSMAMLMASYHVAGKTSWRAYAQADQIHELRKQHDWSVEQIADETRMSPREVQQYLDAYDYLVGEVLPRVTNGTGTDILESKFSHALEFIKNKKIAQLRDKPSVRKQFAKLLITDRIKGAEVRQLDKVYGDRKAAAALKTGGFNAAKKVLTDNDPLAGSKTLKQAAALTKALIRMGQDDIALLKKSAKARSVVAKLQDAVEGVLAVVSEKGKKNGKA